MKIKDLCAQMDWQYQKFRRRIKANDFSPEDLALIAHSMNTLQPYLPPTSVEALTGDPPLPDETLDNIDVRYHASCGQQKRGGIDWNEMTHGEPESHYKGEGKKAVSEVETSLIRRYRNGYEAHYIDRTLHGKTYRMEGNQTGLVALPEEKIMLLTRDWTVVVFLEDLADLNRIECELNLHRIEEK